MYGPKDDGNKFVMWLIDKLYKEVPEIKLTKGEQKRDFIYIDDVVSAYLIVIKNIQNVGFEEFEIGTGIAKHLKRFILKMKKRIETIKQKEIKTKLNFGALAYRDGEPMEIKANIDNLHNRYGWKPKTNINEGLLKTIKERIK